MQSKIAKYVGRVIMAGSICVLFTLCGMGKNALVEAKSTFDFVFMPMEDTKEGKKQVLLAADQDVSFIGYQGKIVFDEKEVEIIEIASEVEGGLFVWNGNDEGKESPVSIVFASTEETQPTRNFVTITYEQKSKQTAKDSAFQVKEVSVFDKEGTNLYQSKTAEVVENENEKEEGQASQNGNSQKGESTNSSNVSTPSKGEGNSSSSEQTDTKVEANKQPGTKQEDTSSVESQAESQSEGQSYKSEESTQEQENQEMIETDTERQDSEDTKEKEKQQSKKDRISRGIAISAAILLIGFMSYQNKKK